MIYAANGEWCVGVGDDIVMFAPPPLCSTVNPGGWAPAAVVRTIAKREICKFVKTFSSSAATAAAATPLTL